MPSDLAIRDRTWYTFEDHVCAGLQCIIIINFHSIPEFSVECNTRNYPYEPVLCPLFCSWNVRQMRLDGKLNQLTMKITIGHRYRIAISPKRHERLDNAAYACDCSPILSRTYRKWLGCPHRVEFWCAAEDMTPWSFSCNVDIRSVCDSMQNVGQASFEWWNFRRNPDTNIWIPLRRAFPWYDVPDERMTENAIYTFRIWNSINGK